MEQEKTCTETELRNEVAKLVKTDLTGIRITLFVMLPILVVAFALLYFAAGLFKTSDMIAIGIAVVFFFVSGLLWHGILKSVNAEKDSLADLARKLETAKKWNSILCCSAPLVCVFVLIFADVLEMEDFAWHWIFVAVMLVIVALFFFSWKIVKSSMKQKFDGLIAKLEEEK